MGSLLPVSNNKGGEPLFGACLNGQPPELAGDALKKISPDPGPIRPETLHDSMSLESLFTVFNDRPIAAINPRVQV